MNKWTVWRTDDNGGTFVVRTGLTREEANQVVAEFTGKGHKQTYFCREAAPTDRPARPAPRIFTGFNDGGEPCLLCNTHDDGETVLAQIDGTEKGTIAEAQQVHLSCLVGGIHYSRQLRAFYVFIP